jgi:putative transposase
MSPGRHPFTQLRPHIRAPSSHDSCGTQAELRRIIYTTNAIESLNSTLRTAVRSRGHFPTDEAAIKLLYLVLRRTEKNWKNAQREWTAAMTQFAIMFGDRFSVE